MIAELSSPSTHHHHHHYYLNFKFSERTFYILLNERKCVARIEVTVFTLLTNSHYLTTIVGKQMHLHLPTTSGLGTPLIKTMQQVA